MSKPGLQRARRLGAVLLAVALPLGLWVGGALPVAVGLVPAPWDKLVHSLVFALLAAAVGLACGARGWRGAALGFGAALAVGVADEWHQAYLPGRSAGWDDLAADALGAALGALALRRWQVQHH